VAEVAAVEGGVQAAQDRGLCGLLPVGWLYDALVKFARGHPQGITKNSLNSCSWEGAWAAGGRGLSLDEEFFRNLAREDFYNDRSNCRKLWNNNLTLGLPGSALTLEGRAFLCPGCKGGGVSRGTGLDEEFFPDLARDDFYYDRLDCRKLWNDNLTLGLPGLASTLEGRAFVPAARKAESPEGQGTSPEDERHLALPVDAPPPPGRAHQKSNWTGG
jgi:hypothetical protein